MTEDWRPSWFAAARANRALLEDSLTLTAGELLAAAAVTATGRAALLLRTLFGEAQKPRREERAARNVAQLLREALPYHFDHGQAIVTVEDAMRRGYWACADTAAAAAAAFVGCRWHLSLCTETVGGIPDYAHTRLFVARAVVEPWPEARRPEARGCTLLDDVSAQLLAQNT